MREPSIEAPKAPSMGTDKKIHLNEIHDTVISYMYISLK